MAVVGDFHRCVAGLRLDDLGVCSEKSSPPRQSQSAPVLPSAAPAAEDRCLGRHRRHLHVVGPADGKTPVEARLHLPSGATTWRRLTSAATTGTEIGRHDQLRSLQAQPSFRGPEARSTVGGRQPIHLTQVGSEQALPGSHFPSIVEDAGL